MERAEKKNECGRGEGEMKKCTCDEINPTNSKKWELCDFCEREKFLEQREMAYERFKEEWES